MAKGIKRKLQEAIRRADEEIRDHARQGGMYARGLSPEGYSGGYYDALCDVQLLLNGVQPQRRGYWETESCEQKDRKTR